MTLPLYTPDRRRQIAKMLNVDEQYIYVISRGIKFASPALARRWHEIDPEATLQDLRPVDWKVIWPELLKPVDKGIVTLAIGLPIVRDEYVKLVNAGLVTDERKTDRRGAV